MFRNRASQLMICVLGLVVATSVLVDSSSAESTATISGGFTTTDAGVFSVGLTAREGAACTASTDGNPVFGPFIIDAVGEANGETPESINVCVLYTDTQADRGPFTVQLSIGSFELKAEQVPTFEGADQAHFQIPNRYLVLATIGEVTGGNADQGVGAVSDLQADAGHDFGSGPLQIASAAAGMGTVSSVQELGLTLNVPAGVYPGEYDSTITVETYTGP